MKRNINNKNTVINGVVEPFLKIKLVPYMRRKKLIKTIRKDFNKWLNDAT
jgi:hypothetical protein